MNSNDYIKKYIDIDTEEYIYLKLKKKSEKLKKFAEYIDLVQKKDVINLLYMANELDFVYKGLINNFISKGKSNYYLSKLICEGFLEEINPIEESLQDMIDYYGSYNVGKMTFYGITRKGKDFLSLRDIKSYMRECIEEEYKQNIEEIKNDTKR